MQTYEQTTIGVHRGAPRLWLQGQKAVRAGFHPGRRYSVRQVPERHMLVLELKKSGNRLVSRKRKNGKVLPVIDINSSSDLSILDGFSAVRVITQKLRIFILPTVVELAKKERLARLKAKIAAAVAIATGSLSHGGGVLTHALHAGLKSAGVDTRLVFANDVRPELLEQASLHNDAWDADTIAVTAPMQEFAFDAWATGELGKVELLEAGLPCSGASLSGRAKNANRCAEAHPEVGHLVVAFLAIIVKVQPAVVVLENVTPYRNTASMCILRSQLRDLGYQVHEAELQAADWNELERRVRLCMVAVTQGIEFDFHRIKQPRPRKRCIAEVLDVIGPGDERWSEMPGLKAKQERDLAAGKGFAMQIVTGDSTACPTITKGYAKVRSTDPKLQHPTDPRLLRQFTLAEHVRMKGIPDHLIAGLGVTLGHELLGQSICYAPFRAVGALVGQAMQALVFTADERLSRAA